METADRDKSTRVGLELTLEQDSGNYNFFALVRLLERLRPGGPRIGGTGPCSDEKIRFHGEASLSFQASEITRIETPTSHPPTDGDPSEGAYHVTTAFMGPTGVSSPLPTYLLEEFAADSPEAARKRAFVDLFHHRMISLFYRAVGRFDYPNEYRSAADDPWSQHILALIGFTEGRQRRTRHISRHQLLRLAPLLASMSRSEETLRLAIADVLDEALGEATVEIEPLTGGWTRLGDTQQAALGQQNHALGDDFVLGDRCFDRAGKAKIVLKGLADHNFRRFMRDGDQFPVLAELVDLFSRDPVNFDLELVLNRAARPSFALGDARGATLGADTWLAEPQCSETRVVVALSTPQQGH
ncbi:MAG: type VI secretion system baseplate subunit TssG [Nannocystaceae bacterium]